MNGASVSGAAGRRPTPLINCVPVVNSLLFLFLYCRSLHYSLRTAHLVVRFFCFFFVNLETLARAKSLIKSLFAFLVEARCLKNWKRWRITNDVFTERRRRRATPADRFTRSTRKRITIASERSLCARIYIFIFISMRVYVNEVVPLLLRSGCLHKN